MGSQAGFAVSAPGRALRPALAGETLAWAVLPLAWPSEAHMPPLGPTSSPGGGSPRFTGILCCCHLCIYLVGLKGWPRARKANAHFPVLSQTYYPGTRHSEVGGGEEDKEGGDLL